MSPGFKGGYENQSKNPSVGCRRETEGLQNTGLGPAVPGAATAVVGARAGGRSGMSRPGSRAMLDDLLRSGGGRLAGSGRAVGHLSGQRQEWTDSPGVGCRILPPNKPAVER